MTDIVIQTKLGGIAVNGLTDPPEITILRVDTDAVVINGAAMSDQATGGLYKYQFNPVAGLSYSFSIDADPNTTDQVDDHFYAGGFDFASQASNSYGDGDVWIDTTGGGSPGTVLGTNGTQSNPSSNIGDAITIANALAFRSFRVRGNVTLNQAFTSGVWTAEAGGGVLDPNGFDVSASIFNTVGITGDFSASGDVFGFQTSILGPCTGLTGVLTRPGLSGTLTGGTGTLTIAQGASLVPGFTTPIIDLNGVCSLNLRAYSGGLDLRGSSAGGQATSLEFTAGQLILDASNTAGSIAVRGIVSPITDNSAGATVNTQAAVQGYRLDRVWHERGCDPDNPTTYRPDKVFAGPEGSPVLEIAVTGDCETETVYTKQNSP